MLEEKHQSQKKIFQKKWPKPERLLQIQDLLMVLSQIRGRNVTLLSI